MSSSVTHILKVIKPGTSHQGSNHHVDADTTPPTKNKHTLYTANIQDFKYVKDQLEATEAKFFSYTPKEEKMQ